METIDKIIAYMQRNYGYEISDEINIQSFHKTYGYYGDIRYDYLRLFFPKTFIEANKNEHYFILFDKEMNEEYDIILEDEMIHNHQYKIEEIKDSIIFNVINAEIDEAEIFDDAYLFTNVYINEVFKEELRSKRN